MTISRGKEMEEQKRLEKLRLAFAEAEETGCEDYPFGGSYFIIGSELKKELDALEMDENDGFYEDYEPIDSLDDESIYLWLDCVLGPYYSFEDYIREDYSEYAGFLSD